MNTSLLNDLQIFQREILSIIKSKIQLLLLILLILSFNKSIGESKFSLKSSNSKSLITGKKPISGIEILNQKSEAALIDVDGVAISFTTKSLEGCVTDYFILKVLNQSGQEKKNVSISINSPGNIFLVDLNNYTTSSLNSTFNVSESTFSIGTMGSTEEVTINIPVTASCKALTGVAGEYNLEYIPAVGSVVGGKQVLPISVTSGYLVYNSDLSTNLDFSSHLGTNFSRTYVYTNNSQSYNFSGVLFFEDSKASVISINSVEVKARNAGSDITASVIKGIGTGIDPITGNVNLKIDIYQLPPNAIVEITESIVVNECPQNAGTTSNIVMKWGCANDPCLDFDEEPSTTLVKIATVRRGTERAELNWIVIENGVIDECIDGTSNPRRYRLRLINQGLDNAYNYTATLRGLFKDSDRTISRIHESDFHVFDPSGICTENIVATSIDNQSGYFRSEDCIQPGENYIQAVYFDIPVMHPGEFIDVEWEEIDCCPLTAGSLLSFQMGSYNIYENGHYYDECGSKRIPLNGMSHSTAGSSINMSGMRQELIPGVSNMHGCKPNRPNRCKESFNECTDAILNSEEFPDCDFTESFAIENNTFSLTGAWPIDMSTYRFEVDFILESTLILAPRSHFVNGSTNTGNVRLMVNGEPFPAASVTSIPVPSGIDYVAPTAYRAIFDFPQELFFNINGKFDVSVMSGFINASELHFDMAAVCGGPEPPGAKPRFLERFYFVPSTNCPTNTCRFLIGEIGESLNVMCPGCDWPGVVTNTFEFKRITVGINDGNNNGLPDAITPNEGIRLSTATYKDKIRSRSVSSFWDSQGMYGNTSNPGVLQLDPDFGLDFLNNFCRLDKIPEGQYLEVDPASIQIIINRNGVDILNTENDIFVPRPYNVVSRLDGKFLFQFPTSFIRQFSGLENFVYQPDDIITVIADYVVERDFEFGVNKYQSSVEIAVEAFLTNGMKDVNCNDQTACDPYNNWVINYPNLAPFDQVRKDFLFICEGWGTKFVWIDGLKELNHNYLDYDVLNQSNKCQKTILLAANFQPGFKTNAFPFEVRNVGRVHFIDIDIPEGYAIDIDDPRTTIYSTISLRGVNDRDYVNLNQYQRLQEGYNMIDIGPASSGIGRKIRILFNYGKHLSDDITVPGNRTQILGNGIAFNSGDEHVTGNAKLMLVPSCSSSVRPTDVTVFSQRTDLFSNPDFENIIPQGSNVVPYPIATFGDLPDNSVEQKQLISVAGAVNLFTLPNGNLVMDPFEASFDVAVRNFCFDISIRNENNIGAQHPFIIPEVTRPGFEITDIRKYKGGDVNDDNNWEVIIPSNGVYSFADLAANGGSTTLKICGTYNCQTSEIGLEEYSTIKVHYGWNCDSDFPKSVDDIDNVCNIQNSTFTFYPRKANLTSHFEFGANPTCEEISYQYTISSIDLGGVYDLKPSLVLPTGVNYKPNSARFVYVNKSNIQSQAVALEPEPEVEPGKIIWDLNKLMNEGVYLIDRQRGLFDQQQIIMTFAVTPNCQYNNDPLTAAVTANSFCNSELTPKENTLATSLTCDRLIVSVSTQTVDCAGGQVELLGGASGGAEPLSYQWYINNVLQEGQTNLSFIGQYLYNSTYTLEVTDSKGCKVSESITPDQRLLGVNAGEDLQICQNQSATLNASVISVEGAEYLWTPSTGLSDPAILNPMASPGVTTTYTLAVSYANGCSASDEVVVAVNPLPTIYITTTDEDQASIICSANSSVSLTANAASDAGIKSYTWYHYDINFNNKTLISEVTTSIIVANEIGWYEVVVEDNNGCTNSSRSKVINDLTMTCDGLICPGDSPKITFSNLNGVVGQYKAQWYKVGSTDPLQSFISEEADYEGYVTTKTCTLKTEVCPVRFKPVPNPYTISPEGPLVILPGETRDLSVVNKDANDLAIVDVYWSIGQKDYNDITIQSPGIYSITAVHKESGCSVSSGVEVLMPGLYITGEGSGEGCGGSRYLNIKTNGFTITNAEYIRWYKIDPVTKAKTEILDDNLFSINRTRLLVSETAYYEAIYTGFNGVEISRMLYVDVSGVAVGPTEMLSDAGGRFENVNECADLDNTDLLNNNREFVSTYNCLNNDFILTDINDPQSLKDPSTLDYSLLWGSYMLNYGPLKPENWNRNLWTGDALEGNGFMLVDGSSEPGGTIVWKKILSIHPYQKFIFKGSVQNIDKGTFYVQSEMPEVFLLVEYVNPATKEKLRLKHDIRTIFTDNAPSWIDLNQIADINLTFPDISASIDPTGFTELEVSLMISGGGIIGRDIGVDNIQLIEFNECTDFSVNSPSNTRMTKSLAYVEIPDQFTCYGIPVTLYAKQLNPGASFTYEWQTSDGTVVTDDDGDIFTLTVNPKTTSDYLFVVKDSETNSITKQKARVRVIIPYININTDNNNLCSASPIHIETNKFSGVAEPTYKWLINGIEAQQSAIGEFIKNDFNNGDIVTCELHSGCKTQNDEPLVVTSNAITIKGPKAVADAGTDKNVCKDNKTEIGTSNSSGLSYTWEPVNGLADAASKVTEATPDQTTIYILTVEDENGCTTSDQVIVTVWKRPVITANADVIVCPGESVNLLAEGGASYTWSPDTYLLNPSISNPVSTPESTITYTVTGIDQNGCTNTDEVVVQVEHVEAPLLSVSGKVLTATVPDGLTAIKYSWYKEGNYLGESTINTYMVNSSGNYSVKVDYSYTTNVCTSESLPLDVVISGKEESSHAQGLSIYPVPASDFISIDFTSVTGKTDVEILDLNGKVVVKKADVSSFESISLDNLSSGVYIIKVFSDANYPVIRHFEIIK